MWRKNDVTVDEYDFFQLIEVLSLKFAAYLVQYPRCVWLIRPKFSTMESGGDDNKGEWANVKT